MLLAPPVKLRCLPKLRTLILRGLQEVLSDNDVMERLAALVLEPGAFSTRRTPFERVLGSFTGAGMLTLQADAGRFRINSFSGQLLDYEPAPSRPAHFEPPE